MDTAEKRPESLTAQAVAGISWSALSNLGRQIFSLVAATVLARVLGPSVYGLMGMANLVMLFLTNFRQLGTAGAVIQRKALSDNLAASLHWINCGLGAVLTIATFAGAGVVASLFREPTLGPILRALAISFLIAAAGTVPSALLARRMEFGKLATVDFISMSTGYALAISMALSGFGVWSLVAGNLLNGAVATTGYWLFSALRPWQRFDWAGVRSVASFSLNFAGFGIVQYFSRNADNAIIGRRLGTVALGYYQMAYQLFMLPISNISGVIGEVLNPAFARIQDDNARFRAAYIRSTTILAFVAFPATAGLAIVADPLVRTCLGPKWIPAIRLLQVLAPIGLLQSVQGSVGRIFVAKGRTDIMFRLGIGTAVVYVASFLVGVQRGALGVAVAYAIACLVVLSYPVWKVPFRLIDLGVGEYLRHFYRQAVVTALMAATTGACLWLLHANGLTPFWELVLSVSAGVLSYAAFALAIRPPALDYIEEILAMSNGAFARRGARLLRRAPRSA